MQSERTIMAVVKVFLLLMAFTHVQSLVQIYSFSGARSCYELISLLLSINHYHSVCLFVCLSCCCLLKKTRCTLSCWFVIMHLSFCRCLLNPGCGFAKIYSTVIAMYFTLMIKHYHPKQPSLHVCKVSSLNLAVALW